MTEKTSNKIAIAIAVGFFLAYVLSPIDLIPDFPVIGQIDELIVGFILAKTSGLLDEIKKAKVSTNDL